MIRIFSIILLMPILIISCSVRQSAQTSSDGETRADELLFDPMASAADREVVPEKYPISAAYIPEAGDSLVEPHDVSYSEFDSAMSDVIPRIVFRVQIFTSRLYAEANHELALAEEIFNLPVHLDYEVPYYKLRVGDFIDREKAEDMLPEIRAIGYRDAWVARVVRKVREIPSFDIIGEPILPLDSAEFSPVRPDTMESQDEGDDL